MSDEIEYIEPTQEHVGQMVEVRQAEMATHRQRTLLAVLPHPIRYRFVCQDSVDAVSSSHWQCARIPRPLTYAERQAKCGLKVGDRVKFVREWGSDEYKHIDCDWVMRRDLIGTVGTVIDIGNHINVQFPQHFRLSWWLPYFVLEKVEDRQPTALDHMAKVYVVGAPQDEFVICHMFSEIDGEIRKAKHFAVIRSGDNRLVYELSNLRVKE